MPRYTSIVSKLSAAVPFVGPEAIERARGKTFQLRLGANESAFGINRIAQAGALASLGDTQFLHDVIGAVQTGREDYRRLADELGLKAIPSATNFLAIDMGSDGERAREVLVRLQERDVFVRMPGVAPLDRCIRVTVGSGKERHLFASIFREVLHELAKDGPQKMSL